MDPAEGSAPIPSTFPHRQLLEYTLLLGSDPPGRLLDNEMSTVSESSLPGARRRMFVIRAVIGRRLSCECARFGEPNDCLRTAQTLDVSSVLP